MRLPKVLCINECFRRFCNEYNHIIESLFVPCVGINSFFINCMTPYYHQSSSTDPWELVWVHFNGATSKEYYQYFASHSAPAWTPKFFQELKDKTVRLLDVNEHSDISAEINSSRLIVDILSIILEDIQCSRESLTLSHQKMMEIRQYLDDKYTEKFSLDDLSEYFFSANFSKKTTAKTAVVFFNKYLKILFNYSS